MQRLVDLFKRKTTMEQQSSLESTEDCQSIEGNDEEAEKLSGDFEIGDQNGNKWMSSDEFIQENHPVTLNIDPTKQHLWRVERCSDEPLWSFSVMSGDKMLFVTYNLNDDQVKLEQRDDTEDEKKRLFTLLLHVDGKIMFRADDSKLNRYLVQTDEGKLAMMTKKNPTQDMGWLITKSFELSSQPNSHDVEIHNNFTSKKWRSVGLLVGNQVEQIQTSAKEKWTVTITADKTITYWKFSANKLPLTSSLCVGNIDSIESAHIKPISSGSGFKLQCKDARALDKYISVGPGNVEFLKWTTKEIDATTWEAVVLSPRF